MLTLIGMSILIILGIALIGAWYGDWEAERGGGLSFGFGALVFSFAFVHHREMLYRISVLIILIILIIVIALVAHSSIIERQANTNWHIGSALRHSRCERRVVLRKAQIEMMESVRSDVFFMSLKRRFLPCDNFLGIQEDSRRNLDVIRGDGSFIPLLKMHTDTLKFSRGGYWLTRARFDDVDVGAITSSKGLLSHCGIGFDRPIIKPRNDKAEKGEASNSNIGPRDIAARPPDISLAVGHYAPPKRVTLHSSALDVSSVLRDSLAVYLPCA
jgi:hypothetical protein